MKSHLTFFCFFRGVGRLCSWERTGAASELRPTPPPSRPRIKKQAVREEEEEKENMLLPATPPAPAPRIPAAEALACWQPADWPGGVGKGAQFGVTGQTWRFWGGWREGDTHTHAPASGRERAQGLFCDAGFQFASARALGHGVSYFVSHHGDRGGQGWQGVVPWALGLVLGYMVPG